MNCHKLYQRAVLTCGCCCRLGMRDPKSRAAHMKAWGPDRSTHPAAETRNQKRGTTLASSMRDSRASTEQRKPTQKQGTQKLDPQNRTETLEQNSASRGLDQRRLQEMATVAPVGQKPSTTVLAAYNAVGSGKCSQIERAILADCLPQRIQHCKGTHGPRWA